MGRSLRFNQIKQLLDQSKDRVRQLGSHSSRTLAPRLVVPSLGVYHTSLSLAIAILAT